MVTILKVLYRTGILAARALSKFAVFQFLYAAGVGYSVIQQKKTGSSGKHIKSTGVNRMLVMLGLYGNQ